MSYFNSIKENDLSFSNEHGIVRVIMIEQRNGIRYVTCETITDDADLPPITFDAIEGELRALSWIEKLPAFNHCYTKYTLREAVQMVVNSAEKHSILLTSINDVQKYLAKELKNCTYDWITGQTAMELITAHIEGKPIKEIAIA